MGNKLTVEERDYLDSLISAKCIMMNSKKHNSNELLSTYIKGIVFPLLENHGVKYEKNYSKLIDTIEFEIKRLTPSSIHNDFYDK